MSSTVFSSPGTEIYLFTYCLVEYILKSAVSAAPKSQRSRSVSARESLMAHCAVT